MPAIICDLDGLLVDSEELHFQAYKTVLSDFGIKLTQQMFIDGWLSGKHYGTYYHLEKAGVTDKNKVEGIRKHKCDVFIDLAKGKLKLMPGVEIFLKRVKEAGLPCGIGTGGHRSEYEFSIKECGLAPYIQAAVGGDDVARNKPAPDIFLKVAEELGAEPSQCVVFENSDIGVSAAISADMRCIVSPSEFTKEQDFSNANQVLSTLEEVDLQALVP